MKTPGQAHVIVVGNEKGGSGKSTAAMHLIVGLLQRRLRVASIDLDTRQRSLTRYLENRRLHAAEQGLKLRMPMHGGIKPSTLDQREAAESEEKQRLDTMIRRLSARNDAIVIDTPGNDTLLTRLAHAAADTLVTPLNDSFVDLDVLADVDPATMRISGPSSYAEMVWEQRKRRTADGGGAIDWIVMRSRLSSLDAHNKREMARLLDELSARIGFRLIAGFGERVVYRELFLKGLTMMDLQRAAGARDLTLSHVAARQEVRVLVDAIGLG